LPRELRRSPTDAELQLWRHLRNSNFAGLKFRRQQTIGPFIVDFYCHMLKLVIEVDGSQHLESQADAERTRWLESSGLHVLRFDNRQVLRELDGVLERVREFVSEVERPPSPKPSPRGGGDQQTLDWVSTAGW
jgi:very-short-patch-repair endonuclease